MILVDALNCVPWDHKRLLAHTEESTSADLEEPNFGATAIDHQIFDIADFVAVVVSDLQTTNILYRVSGNKIRIAEFESVADRSSSG